MTPLSEALAAGQTPKGTSLLSADELEATLGSARAKGLFVQSMEAFTLRDGKEILTLEFSILGLDGPDDWETHRNPERALGLVRAKIEAARKSGDAIAFKVWFDDLPVS